MLCYREFARATGLFREKTMSVLVVLSILALNFAALDNWYDLFVAIHVAGDETLDQIGGGNRGGELDGVDAGVDPMGGLDVVRTRRRISDGDEPEVAALVRAAVRLERDEIGMGGRHLVQPRHELVVAEESVELVRHRRGH